MALKRSADFELVVLKKSGDSDKHSSKKNARFEVLSTKAEMLDPNWNPPQKPAESTKAETLDPNWTPPQKPADSTKSDLNWNPSQKPTDSIEAETLEHNWNPPHKPTDRTRAETLAHQYLTWNPPCKPADSTNGLKCMLRLAAFTGLVCVLLVLIGAVVLGGVNRSALVRYQEESVKEAEIFSRMINNLTTQMRSLEETLRLTRVDLVNTAALLEVRLNGTEGDIEFLIANSSELSSHVESLAANTSKLSSHVESLTANTSELSSHVESLTANTSELSSHVESLAANTSELSSHVKSLAANTSKLSSHVESLTANTSELSSHVESLAANTSELSSHVESLAANTSELSSHVKSLAANTSKLSSHVESLTANTSELSSHVESLAANTSELSSHVKSLAANTSELSSHVKSLTANTSELSSHVESLAANTSELSSHVESLAANTSEFSSQISRLNATTMMNIRTTGMNYARLDSNLNNLRSSLEMVDAFSGCTEVTMSCSPAEHNSNEFLYACSTNSTEISTHVSGKNEGNHMLDMVGHGWVWTGIVCNDHMHIAEYSCSAKGALKHLSWSTLISRGVGLRVVKIHARP